jgi:hypothetical protein
MIKTNTERFQVKMQDKGMLGYTKGILSEKAQIFEDLRTISKYLNI